MFYCGCYSNTIHVSIVILLAWFALCVVMRCLLRNFRYATSLLALRSFVAYSSNSINLSQIILKFDYVHDVYVWLHVVLWLISIISHLESCILHL